MANEVHLIGENVLNPPPKDRWFVDYLPICGGDEITLYRDGEPYTKDLCAALKGAAREICLTGLHFTGHFHLERPRGCALTKPDDAEALQEILAQRSKAGVEVYLVVNQFWPEEADVAAGYWRAYRDLDKLLWKMPNPIRGTIMASGGLPEYLEKTYLFFEYLKAKGNAAKIHCYTDVHQGYIFHSNHQKTIIVDRKIAFWGGIDLTDIDGDRWDTPEHTPGDPRRNFDKPERNWHDLHVRAVKPQGAKVSAVDYVYANFLGRYNHGYLYTPTIGGALASEFPGGPWSAQGGPEKFSERLHLLGGMGARRETGFPKLEPDGKTTRDYVPKSYWYYPRQREPLQKKGTLPWPLVQVVRSMPAGAAGNYARNQHPDWNELRVEVPADEYSSPYYVNPDFEHSARDAYRKGIAAARKFIYLENQWVADDRIWDALFEAAKAHAAEPDFRVLIVLPKKFLAAAGYGSEQTINLVPFVEKLAKIFKDKGHPEHFGVFSVLQPAGQQGPARKQWEVPECAWDYMYVHSKLLIVDDCWLLLGSANAGGISLTGLGVTSEPDTELSSIILDERDAGSLVKKFRKELWAEHLGQSPADVDDYKAGADRFHALAQAQGYDDPAARRVHYNLLYYPSSPKAAKVPNNGKWRHLKWQALEPQVKARIAAPDTIHQTYYNISGPLTAAHMLLVRDPQRYQNLVRNLYDCARDDACCVEVVKEDLLKVAIEPEHPILEVDLMVGAALTDSANWVLDYEGTVSESVATVCSNNDMVRHLTNIVPCRGGVDHMRCESWGELKEAQNASLRLGSDDPGKDPQGKPGVFVAVKIGTELLLQMDEAKVKADKKKPGFDLGDPQYWISRAQGDNPWLRLKRDRCYPLYPGALTPYDVKHVLGDRMYVHLLQPLEFKYRGDEITDLRMRFWTWGANATIEVPAKLFAKNVYGFFAGYYMNAARARAEEKNWHRATRVPLKKDWQREYRHDDIDESSATLTCHSGSLSVEMARRVWYTWEAIGQPRPVAAGQSVPLQWAEASSVNDQDDRLRITATADAVYTLEMRSKT